MEGSSGGGGPASQAVTRHASNRGATATRIPVEVTTDKAAVYPHVLDELAASAGHWTEVYANNRIEADHGQLKRPLRPMRGPKTDQSARVTIAGHALIESIRRGHYESALTNR
jgi:transposase-like protein